MVAKYPYIPQDRLFALQLDPDLSSNPGSSPPVSPHGGHPTLGKFWLDTSVSPAVMRICAVPVASPGYVPAEWSFLGPVVGAGAVGAAYMPLAGDSTKTGNLTVTGFGSFGGSVTASQFNAVGPGNYVGFNDRTTGDEWLWFADQGKAFLWQGGLTKIVADINGNITMAGDYLYLAGGVGPVGSPSGPLIYGDPTTMIFKLGSGNGAMLWQDYSSDNLMALDSAGNLTVVGITDLRSSLHVLTNANIDGVLTASAGGIIGGTLGVSGVIQVNGAGNAVNAPNGNIHTAQSLTADLDITAGRDASITRNLTVSGMATVSGMSHLNGGIDTGSAPITTNGFTDTGGATVLNLFVTGTGPGIITAAGSNVTIGGTLTVNGGGTSLDASNDIHAGGNVRAGNDVIATGVFRGVAGVAGAAPRLAIYNTTDTMCFGWDGQNVSYRLNEATVDRLPWAHTLFGFDLIADSASPTGYSLTIKGPQSGGGTGPPSTYVIYVSVIR